MLFIVFKAHSGLLTSESSVIQLVCHQAAAACLGARHCVVLAVLQLDDASLAPLISPLNDPLIDSVQSFEIISLSKSLSAYIIALQ